MTNKHSLLLAVGVLLSVLLSLVACNRRVDSTEQWRIANEKAFAEYADSTDFIKATVDGSTAYVYKKQTKKGQGNEYPIETSRVLIHYEAYQIAGEKGKLDGNFESEAPARLSLSRGTNGDLISGMRIGIQNMVQGEEALIVIPWHLAYGASRKGNVQAYTAFRYLVRLDSIIPETAE